MYHKTIKQHSFLVANDEKCNSSLEAMEAQIQYCLYASKQESKHSPHKQEKDLSKLIGKAEGEEKQIKWEKYISKQSHI